MEQRPFGRTGEKVSATKLPPKNGRWPATPQMAAQEGGLSGTITPETTFPEGDFRNQLPGMSDEPRDHPLDLERAPAEGAGLGVAASLEQRTPGSGRIDPGLAKAVNAAKAGIRRAAEIRREPLPPSVRRKAVAHLRASDPVMAKVIEKVGPCRLELDTSSTLFAALSRSILYQQISGLAAAAIHKRLIALCGGHEPHPEDILAHSLDDLRAVGLSRQKAAYLHSLAEYVSQGLSLARVRRCDDEEAIRRLTAVKGVGRWTAEILLMFRLGRLDLLPVADYGIQKSMQLAYGMRSLPKPARMHRVSEPWRPYRTVACWYLWRFIDGEAAV